jgi:predicted RNase H-like nuclease (RuvC/YqgF family)
MMRKRIESIKNQLNEIKEKERELLTKKKNLERLERLSNEKLQRKADNRIKILFGAVFLSNCSESDFKRLFSLMHEKDRGYVKKWLKTSKIANMANFSDLI